MMVLLVRQYSQWKLQQVRARNEELEQTVEKRTIEIREALDTLKITQDQLIMQEKMASLGQMTAGIAHEIKNPLAGITGAAQLLSMNLSAEDLELTDLIVSESRRIVSLLEQVEQFGNVTAPQMRAINIHDVLDRARRSAIVGFAADMTVLERYDPSLPWALGDPDQLLQVILNLIKNAAEAAGKDGGTIELKTYYEQSLRVRNGNGEGGKTLPLQIEIIDDGPGLPPEIAADVFEPFVSGRENGTGLGLALVARIAEAHGGRVSVESRPGVGSTFILTLPVPD